MSRHVMRNSLIPIVTLFGLDFGAMLGGAAILTEKAFGLDGIGNYAAEAIPTFDLPRSLFRSPAAGAAAKADFASGYHLTEES